MDAQKILPDVINSTSNRTNTSEGISCVSNDDLITAVLEFLVILMIVLTLCTTIYYGAKSYKLREIPPTHEVLKGIMRMPKGKQRKQALLDACADICYELEEDDDAPLPTKEKQGLYWNEELFLFRFRKGVEWMKGKGRRPKEEV